MFLNFHTHHLHENSNDKQIYNFILPDTEDELNKLSLSEIKANISVGIHPRYTNEEIAPMQIDALRHLVQYQQVVMIGECGLDRNATTPLKVQEQVFIQQIRIAEEVKKPLVLHIVRCFSELLSIQKLIRPKVNMVVHGFNNKTEIAQQLIQKGFYFSLGTALLQANSNAEQALKQIGIDKLFLETDDKTDSIQEIYEKAANILQLTTEQLSEHIWENWIGLTT